MLQLNTSSLNLREPLFLLDIITYTIRYFLCIDVVSKLIQSLARGTSLISAYYLVPQSLRIQYQTCPKVVILQK